jgi:phage tail-like protein
MEEKAELVSSYLQYMPAIYHEDPFMGRFLCVFEDSLSPVERTLANIEMYFDPMMSPENFLPWLASWVNLVLDENWPIQKQRELIHSAVELYCWRGTKRGLREYLRIYTGVEPEIIEHFTADDGGPYAFTVVIRVDDPSTVNEALVRRVIDAEKPAHTTYNLHIERTPRKAQPRPKTDEETDTDKEAKKTDEENATSH